MKKTWWTRADDLDGPLLGRLPRHAALGLRQAISPETAGRWASRVLAAEADLGDDFGGEQRSLGRPWYAHMETGRAAEYFRDAEASDRRVERVLPGMQTLTLSWLSRVLGGTVRRRHGFCGPGVHVFPPGEKVARRGGVFHYDLEGLGPEHKATLPRAVSCVWMLQPPIKRGGLTLYGTTWRGRANWPMDEEPATQRTTTLMTAGDFLVFSSYRLHRINGFSGEQARVSVTCHAVEVDADIWDAWF